MIGDAGEVHELYGLLESQLGDRTTELLMSRMPLAPASELVTRARFDVGMAEMRGEFARIDGRISELDGRINGRISELGGQMHEVAAKVHRTMVLGVIGSSVTTAGLVLAATSIS